ncbi:hypothetical protein PYV61_24225, partial [Roseisolibacter sp. H3M3-2]
MHRSPLYALALAVALSACSTGDVPAAADLLGTDATLAARLGADTAATARAALPDACGTVAAAVRPAAADARRADSLARRGYDAETLGNLADARSLLARAAALDGTNETAAYHLGRTHEALGDRAAAVTAYCRFLSLTPTSSESAEARQRVAVLSQAAPPAPAAQPSAAHVAVGTERAPT